MVKAACHCTAVRLELPRPEWVLDCNCTLCRRYGALWTYPKAGEAVVVQGAELTQEYRWNDEDLSFQRCSQCGCVTHMIAIRESPPFIYGVNARLIPTLDPAAVKLRQIDNGHTGFFWTRSDAAPRAGHHPPMDPPGPNDWR